MQRHLTFPMVFASVASLLVVSGCAEGQYQYDYRGTVLRSDGRTPAEGIRVVPHPARREGIFGAKFRADDPDVVVSGPDGRVAGTMRGWFATPLLWPFPPQECKADKVWVYLPADAERNRWKAVAVPIQVEKADRPCTGTITDLRVVLPDWYTD